MDVLGGIRSWVVIVGGVGLSLMSIRNEVVHSHIRNMSMAKIITKSRPTLSPKIRGEDDKTDRVEAKSDDLVKEKSGLANMLYLRCEWTIQKRGGADERKGWTG